MINQLSYYITRKTNPYQNLALEEYLTKNTEEDEMILYLWQNRQTVVIGKNQNCFGECKVNFLEEDGGFLARRLSGGGAVFHDMGNLNFTFMARKADYDISRQLDVIVKAVSKLGIQAEKSGRNDITIDGRKFSGNAFYEQDGYCYHHGTILLRVDKENMSKYLNVSQAKLNSKGVQSVKSRVTNICEYVPDINVAMMEDCLIQAFAEVYDNKPQALQRSRIDWSEVEKLVGKYASWDWKYGRKIPFDKKLEKRFPWGQMELELCVNQGIIKDINVFSDAMNHEAAEKLQLKLKGCRYLQNDIVESVKSSLTGLEQMQADMVEWICEEM